MVITFLGISLWWASLQPAHTEPPVQLTQPERAGIASSDYIESPDRRRRGELRELIEELNERNVQVILDRAEHASNRCKQRIRHLETEVPIITEEGPVTIMNPWIK